MYTEDSFGTVGSSNLAGLDTTIGIALDHNIRQGYEDRTDKSCGNLCGKFLICVSSNLRKIFHCSR